MITYNNSGNRSGIVAYDAGEDYITVHFATGYWKHYTYTNASTGKSTVDQMKLLAEQGQGLNSYIVKYKPTYSSKC